MRSRPEPERPTALDKAALRALAHPSRLRILTHIRTEGPQTVTRLSDLSGESTAAVSYHVRRLAEVDLIERDPDPHPGAHPREIWWRAQVSRSTVEMPEGAATPDAVMAGYLDAVAAVHASRLQSVARAPHDRLPVLSDALVALTAAQLDELTEKLADLLAGYATSTAGERFLVQYQFLPLPLET